MAVEIHNTNQKEFETTRISKEPVKQLSISELAKALQNHIKENPSLPTHPEPTVDAKALVGKKSVTMTYTSQYTGCLLAACVTMQEKLITRTVRGTTFSDVTTLFLEEVKVDCSQLSLEELLQLRATS